MIAESKRAKIWKNLVTNIAIMITTPVAVKKLTVSWCGVLTGAVIGTLTKVNGAN